MAQVTRIEQVNSTTQRISHYEITEEKIPIMPEDLAGAQITEWNRIKLIFEAESMFNMVCGVALSDHCRTL